MGCDIHSVIQGQWLESDNPDFSCWHTVAEGFRERNYNLFGYLAGVRDDTIKSITERRGLPDGFQILEGHHPIPRNFAHRDFTFLPDDHSPWIYDMGEHSHTWLTRIELEAAWRGNLSHLSEDAYREIDAVCRIFIKTGIQYSHYSNWRIVIGFDS